MKRLLLVSVALIIGLTVFAQMEKVAVVSVYGNKMIDGSDFGSVTALRSLAQDDAFVLDKVIAEFKDKLFNELSKDFPFTLTDESKVVGNQEYKTYAEDQKSSTSDYFYTCPDGYYYLLETNSQSARMFEIFADEDIDGIMYASIDYKLYKTASIAGFGTAKVYAYANIKIFTKDGDKVFNMRVAGVSDDNIKFSLGGTLIEADEIMPLCEQATAEAFVEMKDKLPKSIEKMDKKLDK